MANTSQKDFRSLVLEHEPEFYEIPWVYEFSNGRKFLDSGGNAGIYSPPEIVPTYLLDADGNYIVTAAGDRILIKGYTGT